ncbi:MAG: hypothetical protein COA50_00200 [Flavobacteriaceae bacterium]|nr:MAG: hypothetical protein COA50_00200 [Flavobacteriaceae bacterium]
MKAFDVYTIAKALSQRELERLYDMIKKDIPDKVIIKKNRKRLPDFSVEDGIKYLIDNHMQL